jgi:predicted CXXCH cytochrome family protein
MLAVALVLLPLAAAALAQTKPAKAPAPTSAVPQNTCTSADCHASVKDHKVLHGPVNVDSCDACHKLVDAKAHKYEMLRPAQESCTFCHTMDLAGQKVVHQPLQAGDCLPCHNPHGGETNRFLRGKSMRELCAGCHQDPGTGKKSVHGPVAAGACEACHQPHTSQHAKLLNTEGKTLCFSCHREMSEQLKSVRVKHKPVMEGECSQCHDAHAADFPKQTRQAPMAMCTGCHEHERIGKLAKDAKYKHTIVTSDQACLNCHTAHGSTIASLMRSEPQKVCMSCHATPVKSGTRTIAGVAEVNDPKTVKHGPIQQGNCSGCHNVHGGEISRLLTKPYSEAFYQSFEVEKYDLCFSCHDKQLVQTASTKGLTGFRNGERNLHFVHVNMADRGRSCRACHETHASRQPLHIRESVPYGSWQLPINFKREAAGGSCAPGCHQAYTYNRDNPVAATQPVERK